MISFYLHSIDGNMGGITGVTQFIVLFYHSKCLSFKGVYAVDPIGGTTIHIRNDLIISNRF